MKIEKLIGGVVAFALFALLFWYQSNEQSKLNEWKKKKLAFEAYQKKLKLQKQQGIGVPNTASIAAPASEQAVQGPPRYTEFLAKVKEQRPPAEGWKLRTPTFVATLGPWGGTVDDLAFLHIKEPSFHMELDGSDKPLGELGPHRLLRTYDPAARSFSIRATTGEKGLEIEPWLHADLPDGGHRFERVLSDGDLVVRKDYVPAKGEKDYHFILTVSVLNLGTTERRFGYALVGPAGLVETETANPQPQEAVIALRDREGGVAIEKKYSSVVIEEAKEKKKTFDKTASATTGQQIGFFGLAVKSFACVVVPRSTSHPLGSARGVPLLDLAGRKATPEEKKRLEAGKDSAASQVAIEGVVADFVVPANGEAVSQEYLVYAGPQERTALAEHPEYSPAGIANLIDFASVIPGASKLALLLTKVLLGFHWLTGSWGVSILLLTILVRAFIHPLMVRQVKSSLKMQQLQPELAKIKAKYEGKDGELTPEATKKFQAEQWEVMKKHGVNPIGCLGPMLLQFPVFIGLWNALNYAFELRQASFLWIRDLSEPDVIARLPFDLPFKGTNALCILPILMLVVYIVQMRTMPKPTDPQAAEQQKIMNWMFPILGYMFYTVQSGLLLYYITSALIGMAEQKWIKKRLGVPAPGAPSPAPAPTRS